MTLSKTFAFALGFAALAGCAAGDSADSGKIDDSDTNTNPSGWSANHSWTTDGITVDVSNGTDSGGYDFGMAETGSGNGWGGEDCLETVPAGYDNVTDAGYSFCHHVNTTGGYLTSVFSPDDVVSGSTTLFNNTQDPGITYVLFESSSDACLVWGDDPGYYAAYSCDSI